MEDEERGAGTAAGRSPVGLVDGPFTETKELLGASRGRHAAGRLPVDGKGVVGRRVEWRPVASS